ncbi:MAG: DUF1501 domain-containing protein [Planctomycetaceae bacterium]|nr:MAG: DUF1501 domain-containing protein [Planctomycetaceae bacterium]
MSANRSTHCGRFEPILDRRRLLQRAGGGLGGLALAQLLGSQGLLAADHAGTQPTATRSEATNPLAPRDGHFPAKAKSVIWLFMEGAPSSVDLFDPKPELTKRDGQRISIDVFNGNPGPLMKSPFTFRQYGQSGAWVCDRYPNVARHVDDFAFIKSLHSDSNDHVPALYQINTGLARPGFPAAGAWVTYGLGSENQNLPGFVVLGNNQGVKGGPLNWNAGFLPAAHQGTLFRSQGNPILNLTRPADVSSADQRRQLDLLARLNNRHLEARPGEAELLGRIQSFELAYRMQSEAAGMIDFSQETQATRAMYGLDQEPTRSYGSKCLLARRLVESGVRFVQVYSDGEWDAHSDLTANHTGHCLATDVPIDGLLSDLKQRGLLESTLVIWGGEFGRMPVSQGKDGRDHNPQGFMAWMAGAGIKGGASFGETDEIGYKAVVDPVTVHDLHATLLHLLGLDHKRLTYLHNGRPFRLTDVAGDVLERLLA